jgi:hypothetical protein
MKSILWMAVALAGAPLPSAAQPAPALAYRSAFAEHKPYRDVPLGEWRALNDALAPVTQPAARPGPAASVPPKAVPAPTRPAGQPHSHAHGGQP